MTDEVFVEGPELGSTAHVSRLLFVWVGSVMLAATLLGLWLLVGTVRSR